MIVPEEDEKSHHANVYSKGTGSALLFEFVKNTHCCGMSAHMGKLN